MQSSALAGPAAEILHAARAQKADPKKGAVVAVDTSGSMPQQYCQRVLTDCARALRELGVTHAVLVGFDSSVHDVNHWCIDSWLAHEDNPQLHVLETIAHGMTPQAIVQQMLSRGMGGTVFKPIFEVAKKADIGLVLVVSDLMAQDMHDLKDPKIPTVWVAIYADKTPGLPFGWRVDYPMPDAETCVECGIVTAGVKKLREDAPWMCATCVAVNDKISEGEYEKGELPKEPGP